MIHFFGHTIELPPQFQFLATPLGAFVITALAWVIIGLFFYYFLTYLMKWITRRIPGDIDDIILATIRKPALVLIIVVGILNDLEILELPEDFIASFERIFNSIVTCLVAYLILRLIWDVVGYYGDTYAKETETRVDDVLVPIIELVGPIFVVLIAVIIVLPQWGIDIPTILAGAGIIGIIIGLAVQEPLTNIFSGISLLAEPPFGIGDLIVLYDEQLAERGLCQVMEIGRRATLLYNVYEHSTISVPNKQLANVAINNVTRPTVDVKMSLKVTVSSQSDIEAAQQVLCDLAKGHPNILVSDLANDKLKAMTAKQNFDEKLECAIERLQSEDALHRCIATLDDTLRELIQLVKAHKEQHFTHGELRNLKTWVDVLTPQVDNVLATMKTWTSIPDPWTVLPDERDSQREMWERSNKRFLGKWKILAALLSNPSVDYEMRLDHEAEKFRQWIKTSYKAPAQAWKDPQVTIQNFDSTEVNLLLEFYIDDIRMEHFDRKQRVLTEITSGVRSLFERGLLIQSHASELRLVMRN
jgi:MscS family membrane protein